MMEILSQYYPVALVLVIVIVCYFLLQTKYKKEVASTLLYLVTEAEAEFGSKTGELKYSAVSTWVYEQLPTIARVVLSKKIIDKMIEDTVEYMKEYLKKNSYAKAVIENGTVQI